MSSRADRNGRLHAVSIRTIPIGSRASIPTSEVRLLRQSLTAIRGRASSGAGLWGEDWNDRHHNSSWRSIPATPQLRPVHIRVTPQNQHFRSTELEGVALEEVRQGISIQACEKTNVMRGIGLDPLACMAEGVLQELDEDQDVSHLDLGAAAVFNPTQKD